MSKELMLSARDLIKEKKYDEARAILQNIDHPKAKEWLANLDKIAPAKTVARPKAAPKPKPAIDTEDPDEFLDELMARKRPAQRKPISKKAVASQRKKPGFRYFFVFGLIFIILLGGMLFLAVTALNSEDTDAQSTADAISTENSIGLTGTAAAIESGDFSLTVTAAAATVSDADSGLETTPDPAATPEP